MIATLMGELNMFLGLQDSGSVGLISTTDLFTGKHAGVGVGVGAGMAVFLIALPFHLRFARQLWKFYRGIAEGANIETDLQRGIAELIVERAHVMKSDRI
jgi:hypothetical protein